MTLSEATLRTIADNWTRVKQSVREAAQESGRDPESIRIVGVTKYVEAAETAGLVDAGCNDLGESRPQVLWKKAEALSSREQIRWHLIGHLQTNKIRRTLRSNPLIHSVDSERLLAAISREATEQGREVDVLLEVNISGEDNKTGLSAEELKRLLALEDLPSVRLKGLMAMAGLGSRGQQAVDQFSAVAELRDELASGSGRELSELSMGMSGDYSQAIAAGATMVRIGSALFEGVR